MSDEEKEAQQNIRTEYSALSSYFNTVISFRFTTISFYLAAVGFICKDDPLTGNKALLLLLITASVYLIEIRNRTLYKNLADRAIEIENGWGARRDRFFGHMMCPMPKDRLKVLGVEVPFSITHGRGIDILFCGVFLYGLLFLICQHRGHQQDLIRCVSSWLWHR